MSPMRLLMVPVICFCASVLLCAQSPVAATELVFPYVVIGEGWECDLTLVNQSGGPAGGTIRFFDQLGEPLEVVVNGGAARSELLFNFERSSSLDYTLTGAGSLSLGYARVDRGAGTAAGAVHGLITFRYREGGLALQQVGVRSAALLHNAHLAYDNTLGNRTAVAVLSVGRAPVTLHRYDRYGQPVDQFQLNFAFWGADLLSGFIDQLFPSARQQRGLVRMEAPEGAYLLVLNQNNMILSTSDAFAGILERRVAIRFEEEELWTLRLIREGDLLLGVAQGPAAGSPVERVAGSFREGMLHLSLSHRSEGARRGGNTLLLATTESLDEVSGEAFLLSDEGLSGSGSFSLEKTDPAPF